MKNQDFEKLGLFYLGRVYDPEHPDAAGEPLLYDSKALTTHAVCLGMTGSGKTGLCLAILEEAAIDGIPVIAIDPKGDLGNLLLTFPELRGEDFAPWIDPEEAARQGVTPEELAERTAHQWRTGLAAWGQDGERIRRFRDAVDLAIYTPGSNAGLPITVLRSFMAPPAGLRTQAQAYQERITSAVSGLLALVGIEGDPVSSREQILLANILDHNWRVGRDLDLTTLIRAVQTPPFQKVGVIDVEAFFPAKDRFALALRLNNLIASPGFAAWMEGSPLDIGEFLYTPEGKPRLSILSIAHLSENERMFLVTIVLNEVLAWIRTQPGTSSLRAVLYMDEIFGYFPPSRNPPSKLPMLTLLKQARAFGLGVVLATQNPVDLDYKGLSNTGTWFLGRLQTKRDKERVLEGLEGVSASAGQRFNRQEMDRLLSGLGRRVFLMNHVDEERPVIFQTRWALSYLRGPLTRDQIQALMAPRKRALEEGAREGVNSAPGHEAVEVGPATASEPLAGARGNATSLAHTDGVRPVLPPGVPEFFLPRRGSSDAGLMLRYRPGILGVARLHYTDRKAAVDHWETVVLLRLLDGEPPAEVWNGAEVLHGQIPELDRSPEPDAFFEPLPASLARVQSYAGFTKSLKSHLYREQKLDLWHCPDRRAYSRPGETERDFRLRLTQGFREDRDRALEELRRQYAPRRDKLQGKVQAARDRLDREESQASRSNWDAALALGNSVLGAFLGRKRVTRTTASKATSAAKAANRALRQRSDVDRARAHLDQALEEFTRLELEFQSRIDELEAMQGPDAHRLERIELTPRKADIMVERVVLAWTPWTSTVHGPLQAAYR